MSLSGSYNNIFDEMIERLVEEGITVIAGAGNSRTDSCSRLPAGSNSSITVAGSNSMDGLYRRTNYGACVDIFAPASAIRGANIGCIRCYRYRSGTSMATPLVSGVAAIHLSRKPWLTLADIKATLINEAIHDALTYDDKIIPPSSWTETKNGTPPNTR
jgi:subtilisin family serine protease